MNEFDVLIEKILSSVSLYDNIKYTTPKLMKETPSVYYYGIVENIYLHNDKETVMLYIRCIKGVGTVSMVIDVKKFIIYNLTRKCPV